MDNNFGYYYYLLDACQKPCLMLRLNNTFSIYKLTSCSFCLHLNFWWINALPKEVVSDIKVISFLWGLVQLLFFVCSLCNCLWYPSVLRVSCYDTAFNNTNRGLLLQPEYSGEEGLILPLPCQLWIGLGNCIRQIPSGYSKLWSKCLWTDSLNS